MNTKKCLTILFLLVLTTTVLTAEAATAETPQVGVKAGDWIEYDISHTGTSSPPPTHDVNWMRLQVLEVDGSAFSVNVTARYANGTVGSEVWCLDFSEGNVGGWIIIPADLSVGDSFFDFSIHDHKPVNVTIQSEKQQNVLGATRAVTFANDSFRNKEWDKATGMFVWSTETYKNVTTKSGFYIDDLTVTVQSVGTNIWGPQSSQEQASIFPYLLVIGASLVAAAASAVLLALSKTKKLNLAPARIRIFQVAILTAFVVAVATIAVTPLSESQVPLSFRDINLGMQTLWLAMLLVSMWFRSKGNYNLHGILVLIVVTVTLVGFTGVLVMDPPSTSGMGDYFKSAADVWVFVAHGVFSIPAIAFGVWLVALWRPNSKTFPTKSRRAAQLTTVFWVLSYAVGILDYAVIRAMLG